MPDLSRTDRSTSEAEALIREAHDLLVRAQRWMSGVLPSQEIPGSGAADRARWLTESNEWRDRVRER